MLKAYKYRIYPNTIQRRSFGDHFGCARWVYNWALEKRKSHHEKTGETMSRRELQDELVGLKKDKDWLRQVNSQALLASLINLDTAYKNFFKGRAKFPRFKSKYHGHQSYQCPQHVKVDIITKQVNLPKIKGINIRLHRKFYGDIKTCTVSKSPTDKYYISILVETPEVDPKAVEVEGNKTLGIDLGIKEFAITSSGKKESNHKYLYKSSRKLKLAQRRFFKKVKGSANRAKARRRVAKVYEKLTNQRKYRAHQLSATLVYKSHDTSFALEDLNVQGMMKNHKLAKAIGDCGWHFFIKTLQYKSQWSGKNVIMIDRWFPSSKTCSQCGNVKEELLLSTRTYKCEYCNISLDRDVNAAINIKKAALLQIGQGLPEYKPVDHAMAGTIHHSLVIHGAKQEAATRA